MKFCDIHITRTNSHKTRTTRTPAFWGYLSPPHDYLYHWVILDPKSKEDKVKVTNLQNLPKFQIFECWNKHYTRHTFWSCLIKCANMKRIRWVLLKIQSRHDSVHRRTDGQGETSIPPFQLHWSGAYNECKISNTVMVMYLKKTHSNLHELHPYLPGATELKCQPWIPGFTELTHWHYCSLVNPYGVTEVGPVKVMAWHHQALGHYLNQY